MFGRWRCGVTLKVRSLRGGRAEGGGGWGCGRKHAYLKAKEAWGILDVLRQYSTMYVYIYIYIYCIYVWGRRRSLMVPLSRILGS